MSRATGAVGAVWRGFGLRLGSGLVWLGLASRDGEPVARGNRHGLLRRGGRWLVVRGLASAAFRPGRWGVGLAVAGIAVPGPWWLASIAIVPYGLHRWVSRSSGAWISPILIGVSRRVKTLQLQRRLVKSWTPLMCDLGFSREVGVRRLTRRLKVETRTVTLVPHLGRIKLGEWGLTVSGSLQRLNLGVSALQKVTERIESGLQVPDCTIRKIGPGLFTMDLRHSDPLGETVRLGDLPEPRRYLHVVPARAADGSGVEQSLPPLNLTVGATRAGKSNRSWALIKLILDEGIPLRLRVFDPKRQEFAALAKAAYQYENEVTRWPEFLGHAYGGLMGRQRWLASVGVKELRSFTDYNPLDLMIVDEFLSVLAFRHYDVIVEGRKIKAGPLLTQFASQCLAAGFGLEAGAQLGQKEVLGEVRDLFPTATCLRVPPQASEMVNAVLGPGAASMFPAHEIPASRHTAGVGYSRTPSGSVLRTRVAYLDDDERDEVVQRVAAETARVRAARATARLDDEAEDDREKESVAT